MSKKITIPAILIILVGAAFAAYSFFGPKSSESQKFPTVSPEKKSLGQSVKLTGEVRPLREVDLAFEKSSKISRIYVETNSKVKSGQLLADSDKADLDAQLSAAQAALASSEDQKAQSEYEVKYQKNKLRALKSADGKKYDVAAQKDLVRKAEAGIDVQNDLIRQGRANVQNLRAQVEKASLRSPIDGTVSKVDAEVGEVRSAGISFISIFSESEFKIEASATQLDIGKIKIGDAAKITLDSTGPEASHDASVSSIDPAETSGNGSSLYKVTLEFAKTPENIRPGLTANIGIITEKRSEALTVPAQSVISDGKNDFVMVETLAGKIEKRKIEVGMLSSDGRMEILSGLESGDNILSFSK